MKVSEIDGVLQSYRDRIGALDERILAAVNERTELVGELHRYKDEQGLARVDRGREEQLVRHLVELNGGPLGGDAVAELFEFVLALIKRETTRG